MTGFTSQWEVGDAAITPKKVQGGNSITLGHFCLLVKIIKYLRKGPDAVIWSFSEGRCFIFTHRLSKGAAVVFGSARSAHLDLESMIRK